MNVDVVIIGSGLAALKAYSIISHRRNFNPLIIDFNPLGGVFAPLGFAYKYPKIPIFIDHDVISAFPSCNFTCYPIEARVLKEDNIIDKIKGFAPFNVQRLWFYELAKKKIACFSPQINECILKSLSIYNYMIKKIHDSIRKIDVSNQVVVTAQGLTFRYERLVYTWPLDILIKMISNVGASDLLTLLNDATNKIRYVSIYARSYIVYEKTPNAISHKIELYFHGTKASRSHTIIKVPIAEHTILLYALTSYSEYYPLLPGIGDKIHSELRKHKVLTSSMQVLDYSDVNIVYGLLNIPPKEALEKVCEELKKHNIVLFGRVAEWREYDVPSLLFKHPLLNIV